METFDKLTNTTLIIESAGPDLEKIKIKFDDGVIIHYVDKQDAQQIINHLKQQFQL